MARNKSEQVPAIVQDYLNATRECASHIRDCQTCPGYFVADCAATRAVYHNWVDAQVKVSDGGHKIHVGFTQTWPNTLKRITNSIENTYGTKQVRATLAS